MPIMNVKTTTAEKSFNPSMYSANYSKSKNMSVDSNLDILNVLGPISMKFGMYCRETLFGHIPERF